MSVSKWAYSPEKCDGEYCIGDCDLCYKAEYEVEDLRMLERVSQFKAKPIEECGYPCCEECSDYVGGYCTIPMVVTKQLYLLTADKLVSMGKRLTELENLVYDEILGIDGDANETLYAVEWEDEYGIQRQPMDEGMLKSYREYEKDGVIKDLKILGEFKRKELRI